MAYAFNNIFDLINNTQQNQQNVFAPQDGQTPGQTGPAMQGGEAIGSGQSGVSSQGPSAPQGAGTGAKIGDAAATKSAIASRNIPQTPSFLGQFRGKIAESDKAAQDEANAWAKSQTYDSSLDEGEKTAVGKSLKSGNFADVSGYINPAQAQARDFGYSNADDFTTQAKALETQSGLTEELMKGAGGMYTGRRAKLDADLLMRDAGYMSGVKESQAAAEKALSDRGLYESNVEGETIGKQNTAAEAQKQALAEYLRQTQGGLSQGFDTREKEYLAGLGKTQKEGGGDWTKAASGKYIKDLAGNPKNASLSPYITAAYGGGEFGGRDLIDMQTPGYFGVNQGDIGVGNLATQDEATRWNNINRLLGIGGFKGGADISSEGFDPESRYSLDTKRFGKDVKARASDLQKYDMLTQQMKSLEADAQKAGQSYSPGLDPQWDALSQEKAALEKKLFTSIKATPKPKKGEKKLDFKLPPEADFGSGVDQPGVTERRKTGPSSWKADPITAVHEKAVEAHTKPIDETVKTGNQMLENEKARKKEQKAKEKEKYKQILETIKSKRPGA
jgi:hypothetical protein